MKKDKKPGWLQSTIDYTCPRCRKGPLFVQPMKFSDPLAMHDRCEHCDLRFAPEPGYYWGAMFLSYILSGWALLLITLGLVFYFDWTVEMAMLLVIAIGILSYFKLLRFSRSLYIHLLVSYRPEFDKSKTST